MCGGSWVRAPIGSNQILWNWYLLLLRLACTNNDYVSEWGDISIRELLLQWATTIKIQLSMLVECKADLIIISLKINTFWPWYSWKIAELALNNNHSLLIIQCNTNATSDIPVYIANKRSSLLFQNLTVHPIVLRYRTKLIWNKTLICIIRIPTIANMLD